MIYHLKPSPSSWMSSLGLQQATAMAAIEGAFSIVSSSYPSTSPQFQFFSKPLPLLRLQIFPNYPTLSLKSLMCSLPSFSSRKLKTSHILRCSTVEEQAVVAVETEQEKIVKTPKPNQRRKLFVLNLPWSLAVSDVKELFGQCGTVDDVEVFSSFSMYKLVCMLRYICHTVVVLPSLKLYLFLW